MEPSETSFSRIPGSTHVSWEITSNLVIGKPTYRERKEKKRKMSVFHRTKSISIHIESGSPGKRRYCQIETAILKFEEKMGELWS